MYVREHLQIQSEIGSTLFSLTVNWGLMICYRAEIVRCLTADVLLSLSRQRVSHIKIETWPVERRLCQQQNTQALLHFDTGCSPLLLETLYIACFSIIFTWITSDIILSSYPESFAELLYEAWQIHLRQVLLHSVLFSPWPTVGMQHIASSCWQV